MKESKTLNLDAFGEIMDEFLNWQTTGMILMFTHEG